MSALDKFLQDNDTLTLHTIVTALLNNGHTPSSISDALRRYIDSKVTPGPIIPGKR